MILLILPFIYLSNYLHRKRIRLGDEVADGASGTGPQSARDSKKKKKDAELQNFYRFQQKRDRQNKLEGLRQQFEDDKKRVALLKANRKFKPF